MKKLVILAAIAMLAVSANAAVVTFGGDGSAGLGDLYDNNIQDRISWSSTGNGGPNPELQLNEYYRNRRALLRFDVSSLYGQIGSVESVTLRMTLSRDYAGGNVAINRVLPADSSWEEGSYGWSGFFSSSTFWGLQTSSSYVMLQRYQAWTGAYGTMLSNQAVSGVAGDVVDFTFTGEDLTAMLQAWATAPVYDVNAGAFEDRSLGHVDIANEGLFVRGFDDIFFASAENATYTGPQLIVDYTPVPEPATMSLLAIGGVAALIRRRK
jgi:hypothetical protein